MNELGTVVTSVVLSVAGGGGLGAVLGAVYGRKTAKDQLALETRKHEDALASPKRAHELAELQQAARSLDAAIKAVRIISGLKRVDYEHNLNAIRGNVASGYSAVAAHAPEVARSLYREAQTLFDDDDVVQARPERVVEVLQMALEAVHDAIKRL